MKSKKLVVLLSVLVLATAPAVVAATGCDNTNTPPGTTQTDEYTFKFAGGDGATGTAPADVVKKTDETFTLPANPFVKAGYTFAGWSDGTASTPYAAGATYTTGTSNVTFTAAWTAIDYKVSFAGGTGATGSVADITGKHIGDKVALPANAFTKTDCDFAGWSIDGKTYAAGAEITIGTSNVSATAVWFATGAYVDNIQDSATTATFADGNVTITESGKETVYNYSVVGDVVTFIDTEDDTVTYTGANYDGVVIITVPVQHENFKGKTSLVLSKTALTPISDMGTQGYAQTSNFEDHIYMFDNGLVIACKGYADDVDKYGTFVAQGNHKYDLNFEGDTKSYIISITIMHGTTAVYSMSDGYQDTYTQGSATVTLDGYGAGTIGTSAITYSVMGNMIYIENPDDVVSGIYAFDASAKTIGTEDISADVSYVNFSEYGNVIAYCDGTYFANFDEEFGKYVVTELGVENEYGAVTNLVDGRVEVSSNYGTAVYYKAVNSVADGNYVDNLSSVTATVSGGTLTVTDGTNSMSYTITLKDGEVTLQPASGSSVSGYVVDGVIFASVTVGETTQYVALTKTALTAVSGGAIVSSVNGTDKIYLFNNGISVYYGSSTVIGSYTEHDGTYTANYINEYNSYVFKIIDESGTHKYLLADSVGGEYTVGADTVKLDGYGTWTVGENSGSYSVVKNYDVYVVAFNEDGSIYKIYSYSSWQNKLSVENPTVMPIASKNNFKYLNGLTFADEAKVYSGAGYAEITYTLNDKTTTVLVKKGDVLTINDITFTVSSIDMYQARLTFPNAEGYNGTSAIAYEPDMGGVG